MKINPPKHPLQFLRWFCREDYLEEIEGDLTEVFIKQAETHPRKAKWKFAWSVMMYFRPMFMKSFKDSYSFNSQYMVKNYFTIALRIIFRNKSFSAINIFGLAFGLTGALLLFLWIAQEFRYDQFHADKERIYTAWNRSMDNGKLSCNSTTPRVLAPTLQNDFTAVESATSYGHYATPHLFTVGETRLLKTSGVFTDPAFLTIFSFPFLKGDPTTAFNNPASIVVTETFARQLFGDKEAFGENVSIGESGETFQFTVTGILKDLPSTTDFRFDYIIPFQFYESLGYKDTEWQNNSVTTYLKIKEGIDIENFNNQIKDLKKKNTANKDLTEIFAYPFTKMHLYSRFDNGVPAGGRIEIMRMLGRLGVCLIVIACINFINLSTARAQRRLKEVAVRKVTGAYRSSLVLQFLCESGLIAILASIISLATAYFALPFFNVLIGKQLSLGVGSSWFWLGAFGLVIIVGLLAGAYPAFYLSSFRPVRILKGGNISTSNRNWLRTMLVTLQFGFAMMMVVSTIVVYKQIRYVQDREVGYSKDNLVYQFLAGDLLKNYEAYKNELLQSGVALSVSKSTTPITEQFSGTTGMKWKGKDPNDKTDIERFHIDDDFVGTAELTIIEGRDLDLEKFPSDSSAALLNETALRVMGFEEPIGEIVNDDGREYRVVGVIKDFVFTSPYQKVEPIVLMFGKKDWFNIINIKLNRANEMHQNLNMLSALYSKYNPAYPFEYHFVDVEYARKFTALEATLTITTLFASIAIFIACLGLLGLSTYMIESRVKEIGIRKVMGGSVLSITKLLSMSSLKPIAIGIVLFAPMGWFGIQWWLNTFAYRISLDVWIVLMAALSILFIALIAIGTQTIRAANENPVKSLRSE